MSPAIKAALASLPALWTTEGRDTDDLVLPLRFACRWHRLAWYPVEKDADVLFGLTLMTVPKWRHFHVSELTTSYGGQPVTMDPAHVPMRAPRVPEVAIHDLCDLTPFTATKPKVL